MDEGFPPLGHCILTARKVLPHVPCQSNDCQAGMATRCWEFERSLPNLRNINQCMDSFTTRLTKNRLWALLSYCPFELLIHTSWMTQEGSSTRCTNHAQAHFTPKVRFVWWFSMVIWNTELSKFIEHPWRTKARSGQTGSGYEANMLWPSR